MDDLDRYIKERDKKSPGFAAKVKAAYRRRMKKRRIKELSMEIVSCIKDNNLDWQEAVEYLRGMLDDIMNGKIQ